MPPKAERKEFTDFGLKSEPPADKGKRRYVWDSKTDGLGLRITDKGVKAFVIMPRIKGELWLKTLGTYPQTSLKEARINAGLLLSRIRAGEDPRSEERQEKEAEKAVKIPAAPVDTYTVRKAVAAYEKAHISRLKPRSQLEARRPLEKVLLKRWPERALSDVSKADIREVLAEIVEAGNPVAANRTLANLKAFFNWCLSEDRLTVNPCVGIRQPGGDETSRDRVLSDDEIRTLWPIMEETGYPFGCLAQFLLVTAQRRDEGSNLRWSEISDLDGSNPVWTIPASKNKGGRLHEVPLSPLAVRLLKSLPRIAVELPEGGAPVLSEYVFTTTGKMPVSGFSDGRERMDKMTARTFSKNAHETGKAPSPLERWTLHDLRRTAASGMARDDIPPHVVSRVLNHSPGKAEGITAVYNRHGYLREKRHALEGWAGKLDALIHPVAENVVRMRG
ncbi:Integrase family protein [Candidatus Terasakiella magnetica]|nr:Integrase family protein [Candidatus Terasakiella magnetica]